MALSMGNKSLLKLSFLVMLLMLAGCSTNPPKNINNVCEIYDEYYDWYLAADSV